MHSLTDKHVFTTSTTLLFALCILNWTVSHEVSQCRAGHGGGSADLHIHPQGCCILRRWASLKSPRSPRCCGWCCSPGWWKASHPAHLQSPAQVPSVPQWKCNITICTTHPAIARFHADVKRWCKIYSREALPKWRKKTMNQTPLAPSSNWCLWTPAELWRDSRILFLTLMRTPSLQWWMPLPTRRQTLPG